VQLYPICEKDWARRRVIGVEDDEDG
jgi:hypothetical protein